MDSILTLIVIYLLVQIILAWPLDWRMRVVLLVFLLILVLLGFFGTAYWPRGGGAPRLP